MDEGRRAHALKGTNIVDVNFTLVSQNGSACRYIASDTLKL